MRLPKNFNPIWSFAGRLFVFGTPAKNLALLRRPAKVEVMHLAPLGDSAVAIELDDVITETTLDRVRALAVDLSREPPTGVVDVVPAFTTVTVFYDPARIQGRAALCGELKNRAENIKPLPRGELRTIVIPVCYGGDFGPDLAEVAARTELSEADVIALHAEPRYLVHAIGFTPGFPYLGGLSKKLHVPRRSTPRTTVAAGSVGIGGEHTGVYPQPSPGGWNLIGRTPLALFQPAEEQAALLHVGDRVRFKPINREEFAAWK